MAHTRTKYKSFIHILAREKFWPHTTLLVKTPSWN